MRFKVADAYLLNLDSGAFTPETNNSLAFGSTSTYMADVVTRLITLPEITTPTTPASGFGRIYLKDDSGTLRAYVLQDNGTERELAYV